MKQSEPSTSTSQAGKEFSVSKGWLSGFLKRNALHNIKITGESAIADEIAPKIFPEELAKIIEDGDYSADQVFNADETGLYRKKLSNRTLKKTIIVQLATFGHDFTPSYPKTESMQRHIPHSKGEGNYPFPLAGVNGPFHSYTSPLKAHPSFQDDEAEKKL
ncbi:tigger transposable element-derived protein 1 [Trichonephila clavipes]|nr:tigger transposable element-derived protein 1 [Trichonephila clavipes]